jgi:hypothetical protein
LIVGCLVIDIGDALAPPTFLNRGEQAFFPAVEFNSDILPNCDKMTIKISIFCASHLWAGRHALPAP